MGELTRREFLKRGAVIVSVVGGTLYLNPYLDYVEAITESLDDLTWDKAPCRFCGTGCSVLVGVKDGKIIAVKGDPESSVNKGTLCVKGYSLPFIQYGRDRLTKPLIRKKNGSYDKQGELTEASWDEAMELIAQKAKKTIEDKGPSAVACSAPASGRSGKATPPLSCGRRVYSRTVLR